MKLMELSPLVKGDYREFPGFGVSGFASTDEPWEVSPS